MSSSLNAASLFGTDNFAGNSIFDCDMFIPGVVSPTLVITRTAVGAEFRYSVPKGTYIVYFEAQVDDSTTAVFTEWKVAVTLTGVLVGAQSVGTTLTGSTYDKAYVNCSVLVQMDVTDYMRFTMEVIATAGIPTNNYPYCIFQRV